MDAKKPVLYIHTCRGNTFYLKYGKFKEVKYFSVKVYVWRHILLYIGWTGFNCDIPLCAEGCHEYNGYCKYLIFNLPLTVK